MIQLCAYRRDVEVCHYYLVTVGFGMGKLYTMGLEGDRILR